MANVLAVDGYVVDSVGNVLASKTATLKNNSTGATVSTTTTDSNGKWAFTSLDESLTYKVEIAVGASSSQVAVRRPAGLEMTHAYVRTSLRTAAGATIAFGGATSFAGALTVSTGGAAITGNSTVTGTVTSTGVVTAPSLRLTDTGDASLAGTGHAFQIGPTNSANLIIDQNEIQARSNGANAALFINDGGGNVTIGAPTSVAGALTVTTGGVTVTGNSTITGTLDGITTLTTAFARVTDNAPELRFRESDAGSNEKVWRFVVGSGNLSISTLNDAEDTGGGNSILISRVGNGVATTEFLAAGVAFFRIDHTNQRIATSLVEAAAVPATQNRRLAIYGTSGALMGYIPLYN